MFLGKISNVESATIAQFAVVVIAHAPQAAVALDKQAVFKSSGNRHDIAGYNLLGAIGID